MSNTTSHFCNFLIIKRKTSFLRLSHDPRKWDVTGAFTPFMDLPTSTNIGMTSRKPHLVNILSCVIIDIVEFGKFDARDI
ncbi:hypothetical protein HG530_008644 [Fusarium avenaceum]|nr:hypothetical protein HG530_008644 [Fusarium avenaceum]